MLRSISLTQAASMGPLPEMLEEVGGFDCVNLVFDLAGLPNYGYKKTSRRRWSN